MFIYFFLQNFCLAANLGAGPVHVGLAQSGVAAVEASESLVTNPASLAHLSGVWLTMGTQQLKAGNSTLSENFISISENSFDSLIPAGFFVQERVFSGTSSRYDQDFIFSMGNFFLPTVSLGLNITSRKSVIGDRTERQTSPTIGAMWTPTEALGLGLTFNHISPVNEQAPIDSQLQQGHSIGLTYLFSNFIRFRLDTQRNETMSLTDTAGGFESLLSEWIIFRAGYGKSSPENMEKYSMGISFLGPKFHIHYGYQELRQKPLGVLHAVDFNIPF